jgi:hypothetical protein
MYVVNQNPDDPSTFGEWSVDNNTTDNIGMRCDDYSNDIGFDFGLDSLSVNQHLDFINGILYYSFGNWKLLPRNRDDIAGYHTLTGIENDPMNVLEVKMYPNPVKDMLHVSLNLNQSQQVNVELRELNGRVLRTEKSFLPSGIHGYDWSCKELPSGIYMLSIAGDQFSYADKVVVVK